jgi:hypothetical protein
MTRSIIVDRLRRRVAVALVAAHAAEFPHVAHDIVRVVEVRPRGANSAARSSRTSPRKMEQPLVLVEEVVVWAREGGTRRGRGSFA